MQTCQKCEGQGVIDRGGKLYECECERLRRIAMTMDTHIRKADVLDAHIEHELVDMVKQMVYVIGSWADMKAIIKIAIIKHYPRMIKITSDALIRNVFVGGASKQSRSADFEGEVYSNLQDYMDAPDLMIVRLNELSYKNKAAAGALEEALVYRLDREKPTWVLSDVDRPFTVHSHAYSQSVGELVNSAFKKLSVNRIAPRIQFENTILATNHLNANPTALSSAESKPNESFLQPEEAPLTMPGSDPNPKPRKNSNFGRDIDAKPKPRPRIQPGDDDDFTGGIGQGVKKSKPFGGRS